MMRHLRDIPIRQKVTRIIFLASIVALLAAGSVVLLYDSTTFQPHVYRDFMALAKLYTLTLPAPLHFNDPKAAQEDLMTLKLRSEVTLACVYKLDGSIFAKYVQSPEILDPCPLSISKQSEHRFEDSQLLLFQPILYDSEVAGYLFLQRDLPPLYTRLPQYEIMIIVVVLSLVALSVFLSHALKKSITDPVHDLVNTFQMISAQKNYHLRGVKRGQDEIGNLTDAFNQMLATIEHSDRALLQSLQIRDDFISMASHELKTPLTPLSVQIQMMKRYLLSGTFAAHPQAEALNKLLNDSQQQVNRLIRLIEDMLDVSRISSGRLELQYEKVDLCQLVKSVVQQYSDEIQKAGCFLQLHAAGSVVGHWDRLRIEQVVINLLTNAMKYGRGKPIEVSVQSQEGHALLKVRDYGIGIPKENQAIIFERFERVAPSAGFSGFGLGLYIAKQIISALSGTIEVESASGKGSTFTVRLPLEL